MEEDHLPRRSGRSQFALEPSRLHRCGGLAVRFRCTVEREKVHRSDDNVIISFVVWKGEIGAVARCAVAAPAAVGELVVAENRPQAPRGNPRSIWLPYLGRDGRR